MRLARKLHDFLRQLHAHELGLLLQDGQAHLDVGRLQVGDQPPLEAGHQPMLEVLNFAGRPVAGQHDLLVRLVQRVERVKELLLNPLLAGQELDVVNQQHVRLPVFLAEAGELVVLDAVDVFVGEFLRGEVGHARALLVRRRHAGRWRAADGSCPDRRRRRGTAGCRTCRAPGPRPARRRRRSCCCCRRRKCRTCSSG